MRRLHAPCVVALALLLGRAPRAAAAAAPTEALEAAATVAGSIEANEAAAAAPAAPTAPVAAPAPGPATDPLVPRFAHQPVAAAPADQALRVRATLSAAHLVAQVTLRYRQRGEAGWHDAPFALAPEGYLVAEVPASVMSAGVLEYHVVSRSAADPTGPETARFATAAAPHPVIVEGDEVRWRRELLAAHLGNRSRFMLSGEYVDFGVRNHEDLTTGVMDPYREHYYRLELDYTYRMLSAIYSIRLGAGLMRGDTFKREGSHEVAIPPTDPVGLTYGFTEVRFRLHRVLRLNLRALLGAGPRHFDGGGGGEFLFGYDPGTHFAVGFEGITSIGIKAWFRLAWNTVPRVPMSFTAEATNFPLNGEVGGRVFLSAAVRAGRHFMLQAQIGYAFRDFNLGGPVAGLATMVEF